ncbi:MAG TPA: hypothetical protein ENK62_09370 [Chromatiales bacterium]|nr:hypothetical protein [Chromatiales bacterium]
MSPRLRLKDVLVPVDPGEPGLLPEERLARAVVRDCLMTLANPERAKKLRRWNEDLALHYEREFVKSAWFAWWCHAARLDPHVIRRRLAEKGLI